MQTYEMLSDMITELMEIRLVQYNIYKCLHLKPVALSQCPCRYAVTTDMQSILFEIRFLLHLTHRFPTFTSVLFYELTSIVAG